MKLTFIKYILILLLFSCNKEESSPDIEESSLPYTVSGRVTNSFGVGIEGVQIFYSTSESTLTDHKGYWVITDLYGQNTITSIATDYNFIPSAIQVNASSEDLFFTGTRIPSENETRIFNWFNNQQLSNGLLESVENGNIVSLYDNALAAIVVILRVDFTKSESILNLVVALYCLELTSGVVFF